MLFNSTIKRQRAAVEVKLSLAQSALGQRGYRPSPTATQLHATEKPLTPAALVLRHTSPARLLTFSFVAGSVVAFATHRSPGGSTAKTLGHVTDTIRTAVAAVALAKTVHELTKEQV